MKVTDANLGNKDDAKVVTDKKRPIEDEEGDKAKRQKVEERSEDDLRKEVKEKYLAEMPEDFFAFWTFCKERNQEHPEEAVLGVTGLRLVGPYDVMAGKKGDKPGQCYTKYSLNNVLKHPYVGQCMYCTM